MHAHTKIYMSLADSRRMALDHPVGDPFGGPAYGERNMPAAAVVGLAMSGAALASGAAFLSLAGLSFVGSAISLVGSVTGNKALSNIGGIMSLGAGIGAVVSNWGAISSTFGIGETANVGAEITSEGANSITSNLAPDVAPSTGAMTETLSDVGSSVAKEATSSSGIIDNAFIDQIGDATASGMNPIQQTPLTSMSADRALDAANSEWQHVGGASAYTPGAEPGAMTTGGATNSPTAQSTGFAGRSTITDPAAYQPKATSLGEWLKQNKELVEIGGKTLAGIGDSMAKQDAAKLQSEAYLAAQQNNFDRADELMRRYSESVKALAVRDNINPNANIYNTPNGQNITRGIINRNLTGQPA